MGERQQKQKPLIGIKTIEQTAFFRSKLECKNENEPTQQQQPKAI